MPTRTATTKWTGDLESGSGTVSLDSSGAGQFEVSFPTRAGETQGQTNPEELIAAAHTACFAMNLAGMLGSKDLKADSYTIKSDVSFGKVPDGFAITGIKLTLRASVPGVDDATFADLASEAERTCPVSKALAGTTITLDAALEG